jgi:2-methylcitrate dehydratase PrpD
VRPLTDDEADVILECARQDLFSVSVRMNGSFGVEIFQAAHDKPRMQEPAVLRQRAKVNLVRDEELSKVLPLRVTIVEIDLTDGNRLSERVAAVRGTPRNPMSRAEVIEKARDLIVPRLGRDTSERLIETVFAIEGMTDIRKLQSLLQRG